MTSAVGQIPGSLIDWAAGVIGIPSSVVAAQINEESGGNLGAVSPTGAQGPAQFEPATWSGLGCTGSPYDANSAMKCYATYMYQLVKQEKGNVRNALAAYNAGPGNLAAGYGYADTILSNAGQKATLTGSSGPGTGNTSSAAPAAGSATCLTGQVLGICPLQKSQARALIGGMLMIAGGMIALPGIILLAAFAFRGSGAAGAAGQSATVLEGVPGYGHAISYARERSAVRREQREADMRRAARAGRS